VLVTEEKILWGGGQGFFAAESADPGFLLDDGTCFSVRDHFQVWKDFMALRLAVQI
jgi:hypothetical protein